MQKSISRLKSAIDLAEFSPGKHYSTVQIAAFLKTDGKTVQEAVKAVAASGLIVVTEDGVEVAAIDRAAVFAQCATFAAMEEAIVAAAARKITEVQKKAMRPKLALFIQSGLVGDIGSVMRYDLELERMIGEIAGMSEEVNGLLAMKGEFKRAWCAQNRLRNVKQDVTMLQVLVGHILEGDAEAAQQTVRQFFADVQARI